MERLTAQDPSAEVIGQAMLAFVECTNSDEIAPLLTAQGLNRIEPQTWYPLQPYLNVFRAIIDQRSGAMFNLVSVGTKVSEMALLPPQMDSIETAMRMVDAGYQINHRNGNVGHMTANFLGPRMVEVVDSSCYPDDFMYGVLFGLARRFKSEGDDLVVRHMTDRPCRKQGADSCTYLVTW